MWTQGIAVLGIGLLALFGLGMANRLYDLRIPNDLSRAVAAIFGGMAYLMAVLWLEASVAIALSGTVTITLLMVRLLVPRQLRGTGGSARTHTWAEITYPLAGTASLGLGWGLLGNRWLAFLPIAFVAWGDSLAGVARAHDRSRNMQSNWPTTTMLGACLGIAALYEPYWIGAFGAMAATMVERLSPRAHGL